MSNPLQKMDLVELQKLSLQTQDELIKLSGIDCLGPGFVLDEAGCEAFNWALRVLDKVACGNSENRIVARLAACSILRLSIIAYIQHMELHVLHGIEDDNSKLRETVAHLTSKL